MRHCMQTQSWLCFMGCLMVTIGCLDESKPDPNDSSPPSSNPQQCSHTNDCELGDICASGVCVEDASSNHSSDAGTVTSTTDAGHSTATVIDGGSASDTPVVDAGTPTAPDPFTIRITTPLTQRGYFTIDMLSFKAVMTTTLSDVDPTTLSIHWSTEETPALHTSFDIDTMASTFNAVLNPGHHTVTAKLMQNETLLAQDSIVLTMCEYGTLLDFSVAPDDTQWYSLVDRGNTTRNIWHPDGYVELTNDYSQHAALFYLGQKIDPGDLRMTFKVSLGHCSTPGYCPSPTDGADGFAVSIFDVPDSATLKNIIDNHTSTGGTLGFLLVNDSSGNPPPVVDAFHLEFDTYYNQLSWGHSHTDPTSQDHIQVHVDGNMVGDLDDSPDNVAELWASVPELEDNEWHDVVITIAGNQLSVTWDEATIIEGTVPNFNFKGGFLGVTSTTGGLYSYQRIDDLNIIDNCPYEAPPE
jgi:hypothetical protein